MTLSFAADDAAEAERLDALTEVFICAALRPRVRLRERLIAQGLYVRAYVPSGFMRAHRHLSARSGRVPPHGGYYIVLRSEPGPETVRLPFA